MKWKAVLAMILPIAMGFVAGTGGAQAGVLDSYSELVGNNDTLNSWSGEEEENALNSTSTSTWSDSAETDASGGYGAINLAQQACEAEEGTYWSNGSCKTDYAYYCRKTGGTWTNGKCKAASSEYSSSAGSAVYATRSGSTRGGKFGWPVGSVTTAYVKEAPSYSLYSFDSGYGDSGVRVKIIESGSRVLARVEGVVYYGGRIRGYEYRGTYNVTNTGLLELNNGLTFITPHYVRVTRYTTVDVGSGDHQEQRAYSDVSGF